MKSILCNIFLKRNGMYIYNIYIYIYITLNHQQHEKYNACVIMTWQDVISQRAIMREDYGAYPNTRLYINISPPHLFCSFHGQDSLFFPSPKILVIKQPRQKHISVIIADQISPTCQLHHQHRTPRKTIT